jgi:hypothetical protein
MGVKAELEEAEEVVQVYLPVPFGVEGERKVDTGDLPRKA